MNTQKFLNAYKVKATVNGKTWLTKGTTLTANNESEAIEKSKKILMLTSEHNINIEPCKVYHVNSKLTTDSYPYGWQKTTAFFSVELNNKGCRTVFQTINPKNNKLNKPKNSTYYKVILPIELKNGHFEYCGYLDFNGTESINIGLNFLNDFKELFEPEHLKQFALDLIVMSKINAKAQVIYCGTNWDNMKQYYETPINTLVKIANGESMDFLSCVLNYEAIEALKVPDFNPFKVTEYKIN